jgi:DNA-binding NtrC family response regulator
VKLSTPKRLLFVDDEPGIRNTLPVILKMYGFTVTVAPKVSDALDQIRSREFDLLVCDLNIETAGDGLNVIRAMRQANPHCVTVVLTGHPTVETAVEGIHLEIDDYIVKPSNADVLVAVLAEKLAKQEQKKVTFPNVGSILAENEKQDGKTIKAS